MKVNTDRLYVMMSDRQFNVRTLASEAGISESAAKKAYKGEEVRPRTIGKIAAALGVPVESLILDEKAEQKKAEEDRDTLLLRFATLSEKQQELSARGLQFAADILGKELKNIQEKLG